MSKLLYVGLGLWLGTLGCGGSKPGTRGTPTPTSTPAPPPQVTVGRVRAQPVATKLDLPGTITAEYSVNVTADVGGRVMDVHVALGDRVVKGQQLMLLDTSDTQAQLRVDEANLNEARAQLGLNRPGDRLRSRTEVPSVQKAKAVLEDAEQSYRDYVELRKQELVSDMQLSEYRKNYLSARADYEAALLGVNQNLAHLRTIEASIQQSQEKLSQATVYSPIDGVVQECQVFPGDAMQQGSKSGLVIVGGRHFVTVDVPQEQLSHMQPGRKVEVRTSAYPGRVAVARVLQISPVANPRTRTIAVRALLSAADRWLVPGLNVRTRTITQVQKNQLVVPEGAILTVAGKSQVFRVAGNATEAPVQTVPVTLATVVGDEIQVHGALKAGERLVVSDLPALHEGVVVRVRGELPAPAPTLHR